MKPFRPRTHHAAGPEAIHAQIHKLAIGKTITAIYLGDDDPEPIINEDLSDNPPADGIYRGEYLAFEFSGGTALALYADGNALYVEHVVKRVLKLAKDR